jgi:branched-chain amino acid transport system substrate-binding protein
MVARRWRVLVGGALLCTLVGAACSSSAKPGASSSGSSATTTVASAADLGTKHPASGTPFKVGFVTAGTSPLGDEHDEIAMTQATVKYVNDYLGGIAGRPLELDICQDHTTGAGAAACANQMLADKVPVVLTAVVSQPGPLMNLLAPAKVPVFFGVTADANALISPDSFVLDNPLAFVASPLKSAKQDGVKKIAMVTVDVAAASALPSLAAPIYKKAGVDLITSKVPLSAADVTPQVQAAISSGAQEFFLIGDNDLCVSALKAIKTLGFDGAVVSNINCLDTPAGKSIGGFDKLIYAGGSATSDLDTEVQMFHKVASVYAPQINEPDGGSIPAHYQIVLAFARAMKALTPDQFTSPGIYKALLAMKPQPYPLLAGGTFQCDRKKSSLLVASCANVAILETLDSNGKVIKVEPFDATPYL